MRTWILATGSILIFTAILPAQEKPLSIQGTFSSGFYSSYTRGGGNGSQSIHFVPAGATLDVKGYYMTPDLLNLWIQPEFNASPQASDAGFQGGNGIRTRVNMFRRSPFRVTFRYSDVQLEDVYFGSLSRISSFSLKNRNKDLGFTSELHRAGLPDVTIDWGTGSITSKSGIETVPDYHSEAEHLNVDSKFVRWGWDLQGFAHLQKQTADQVAPVGEDAMISSLKQEVVQYQGSARRSILKDSELYLEAGSQNTTNLLLSRPIDMTTRYAAANLRLFQRGNWKLSLHAGYTSNIAGLLLTQLIGNLGSNGLMAPDAGIPQPLQHTMSNLNLNALTTVNMAYGLSLYGSADRTAVLEANGNGLRSSYFITTGGMTYAGTFRWGSLSGQYGRELGVGSVIGQSGRIQGQNYTATVQHGNHDGLQFDFSIHGTDQTIRNEQNADNHSFSSDASVGLPVFAAITIRIGGGWQQSNFKGAGSEFHTKGYTAHASIEHPRFQVNGSLNNSVGNSLQAYGQLLDGLGVVPSLLAPLGLVPSDMRGFAVSVHANPTRKSELSALWTRSIQHLEGVVANDFEIIDVQATYQFRKLRFSLGFFRSDQLFSSYLATYPDTRRGRFYFRVSRTEKFL